MKHSMKHTLRTILLIVLTVLLFFPSIVAVQSADVIGAVLSTDIRAFINNAEIPVYNISGKLAVIVTDLNNYGFTTEYNDSLRKTTITRNVNASDFVSIASGKNDLPIGTPLMPVYPTDITVELDGRKVEAFNFDNHMAIYFNDLGVYGNYWFDNVSRASFLILSDSVPVNLWADFDNYNRQYSFEQAIVVDTTAESKSITDSEYITKTFETTSIVSEGTYTSEESKSSVSKETTEAKEQTESTPPQTGSYNYVLNKNTKKFHRLSCSSVKQIAAKNRWNYSGSRKDVIAMGYVPCKKCTP